MIWLGNLILKKWASLSCSREYNGVWCCHAVPCLAQPFALCASFIEYPELEGNQEDHWDQLLDPQKADPFDRRCLTSYVKKCPFGPLWPFVVISSGFWMFTSLILLQVSNFAPLSCVGSFCTKLEVKVLGSVGCDKKHFSSLAFSSVSEPVLFYRDFAALCCPGKLLCPELPVFSHQLCLQNYAVQLEFNFPVSACQGDISYSTMFEIQLLILGEVKPLNSFYFSIPLFPSKLAVNVFHFALKKRHSFFDGIVALHSAASKRLRKYGATLQNPSSGDMKILQLHFWLYEFLPMGNIAGGLQCWGISMPAADLVRGKCGWCATSTSCEFLVPSQSPAFLQQETKIGYSVLGAMCARVKMSKKAENPIYFHLFHHLGGRRSLWMNCLKDRFPQTSIIFVFAHTLGRHLCLALSTWRIA